MYGMKIAIFTLMSVHVMHIKPWFSIEANAEPKNGIALPYGSISTTLNSLSPGVLAMNFLQSECSIFISFYANPS